MASFLLFASAAIHLLNKKGFCNYADIFDGPRHKTFGFRYHHAPRRLFNALKNSGYPPQMIAIATAELIPLNKETRRGPLAGSRNEISSLAKKAVKRDGQYQELNLALQKERDFVIGRIPANMLRASQVDALIANGAYDSFDGSDDPAEELDKKLKWREPGEKEVGDYRKESYRDWLLRRLRRMRQIKGTPAHRIDFYGGVTLSRSLVSYYKNALRGEYSRCRDFISSLLKHKPLAPYRSRISAHAPLANAVFQEAVKHRRQLKGSLPE